MVMTREASSIFWAMFLALIFAFSSAESFWPMPGVCTRKINKAAAAVIVMKLLKVCFMGDPLAVLGTRRHEFPTGQRHCPQQSRFGSVPGAAGFDRHAFAERAFEVGLGDVALLEEDRRGTFKRPSLRLAVFVDFHGQLNVRIPPIGPGQSAGGCNAKIGRA